MAGRATNINAELTNENWEAIWVQTPLSVDWDSVYVKDIDADNGTDIWTFTWTINSLFNNYNTEITDTSWTDPKTFTIRFNRPIESNSIWIWSATWNFSNVKIILKDLSWTARVTVDDSVSDTKYTSNLYQFTPNAFIEMVVEFHTTDAVKLNGMLISKSTNSISRIQAIKDDGSVTNIWATDSGNLKITDAENWLAIAKWDVTGTSFVHKFGNTPDFDTWDNAVTVWDGANDGWIDEMTYNYSSTAAIDSLSSSDNSDTQDIEVQWLDSNYDLVTQTITLTWQTRVALTTDLIRVFRLTNVWSTDVAWTIYCFENVALTSWVPNDTTKVRAVIQIWNNQTLMAVYTIPNGKTWYMRSFFASTAWASKSSNYQIRLKARPNWQVFQLKHLTAIEDWWTSSIQHKYIEPEVFSAKTDIEMTAQMLASATAASISVWFDIVLVDD